MVGSQRWLPHPLFSAVVLIVWLLLINELAVIPVITGMAIALVLPRLTHRFWPEHPRVRQPWRLASYLAMVLWDILVANLAVAKLILAPGISVRPQFVQLPLAVNDPFAVTLLAATISLTPGTVSVDVSENRDFLLVHCLDVDDPDAVAMRIKERYERRLREIFG